MQKFEWFIVGLLVIVWLSHLIGVFTPEVGFDAVWYHLPVIQAVTQAHHLVYLPNLYQSVNPLFSDLIFGIGYFFGHELGAKLIAYLFGIALIGATYKLSLKVMSRKWALVTILVVSTFQVVAWQSSSFYVDVAKAFWEICMLWMLLEWKETSQKKYLVGAGLLFGASVGTKLFSLLLLPVVLILIAWCAKNTQKLRSVGVFLVSFVLIPFPFLLFAYHSTGNAFYSFGEHLGKFDQIGMSASPLAHIWARTLQLPQFLSTVVLVRDYTSLILVLFLPLIIVFWKKIIGDRLLSILAVWTIAQMALWWYLPPLSTRYALSGFVTWAILSVWAAAAWTRKQPSVRLPLLITIGLAVAIAFAPRILVNYRSLKYLTGKQSKEAYIRQFFDGSIDTHLKAWYHLD